MIKFLVILFFVVVFVLGGAMVLLRTAKPPKIDHPEKLNRHWDDDED